MKVLILAAGYAVRLYPLTKQYPKPLLKVKGRPIIDYIIDKLRPIDEIDEIFVVTNSKFVSIFERWAKRLKINKRISLIDDLTLTPEDKRGAIGDMVFSINNKRIKDDLLVIGGDNLFNADLNEFLYFVKRKKSGVIGAYDLKNKRQANKYGVIQLNKAGKIIDFEEKPQFPKSTLVAMCLYYFPRIKLKLIRKYFKDKKHKSDAMGFYIDWLRKNDSVYSYVFKGKWFDIGDHNFYNKAKEAFADNNDKTKQKN